MSQAPTATLKYVPITAGNHDLNACAPPKDLDLAEEFAGKKVVLTGAPGAFTPTCSEQHIPDYLAHLKDFKAKGVDKIIVVTANDPFVDAAWGKVLGYIDEENYIVFASDINAAYSKQLGESYATDLTKAGLGIRTSRYAAIINDGKIEFLENEDSLGYTEISNAQTILEKL